MAIVKPFCGIRYDLSKTGTDLSALACPPYDIVPPAWQKQLYQRHPLNFIRVDLNQAEPGDAPESVYDRSAEIWRSWLTEGVLNRDDNPCFYLYRQTFTATVGGLDNRYTRTGLIASVQCDAPDADRVLPHEGTLSAPKEDRHKLAKRLEAFTGQVFLLYTDPLRTVEKATESVIEAGPWARFLDDDSVEHCLYVVDDPRTIELLEKALSGKTCQIADGHHRWETGRRVWSELDPDKKRHHGVLATLVNTEDPGLVVLPIHRIYRDIAGLDADGLKQKLSSRFTVEEFPYAGVDAAEALLATVADTEHGFVVRWKGADSVLLIHAPKGEFGLFAPHSKEWSELDLAVLQKVIQEELLGVDPGTYSDGTHVTAIMEGHLLMDYLDGTTDSQFALLVNPTSIASIESVARNGDLMPQKSTLFHPKIWSGLVSLPFDS
jgi:uncharacterized protein (DUF1015 family)